MAPRAVLLLALALAAPAAQALTWKTCGSGVMTPTLVTLTPDPAVAGKPLSVTVPGSTTEPVGDGKISVLVSYTGMPVYETAVALCDTVDCPVAPGPVTVRYNTTLPGIAPPGPYGIKFSAADQAGDALFCVEMAFQITPPHAAASGILGAEGAGVLRPGGGSGGILAGAVKRDALGELRAAFRVINGGKPSMAAAADVSAAPPL